jgi:hypothetical protein
MAKKQTTLKETASEAPSARVAKPRTPRVKTAQHSKVVSSEPVAIQATHHSGSENPGASENPHKAISEIAYSYWEARGYDHGRHLEDWFRAEQEFRQRAARR